MKILLIAIMMLTADQPRQALVFYNAEGVALLEKQSKEFKINEGGLTERDIQFTPIQLSKETGSKWSRWKVDTSSAFTFILVGRDGGEKHRSTEFVSAKELFALVDAMPMRKSEIKNNR
ncbi:DUF4174 domain-containing protein [Dyadobacter arcticus]|uniref:DUF4174 domain-containing protein n=1 Tax=Dyadobacter arcticus TaxID=1078754 RepID=A0ABX0UJ19_9BACT|nr:DUF4174 domain-containing protein [Dyadobacter arcticus]NIJ52498.1 hypothetical protein [Dyadobacter arcticus]